MMQRRLLLSMVGRALRRSRIVALTGPRQCGKTTLARQLLPAGAAGYFDLEDPADAARLEQPMTALAPLRGLVVIDEVQRHPGLFPVLRVLADRRPLPARFLLLGSASPALMTHTSESLAGRLELIEMSGFGLAEIGPENIDRHWLRGGLPRSYLAKTGDDSLAWRRDYVRMVLERDVPQLGYRLPVAALSRFWAMLAHYHGQVWNAAVPARSLGISEPTVRRYLDVLTDLCLVRQLQPWHANIGKRQVKSPKIYFRDSGLLHAVLGIRTTAELLAHPGCGASWEGYALEQALQALAPDDAHFWATHTGAEIDLVIGKGGRRYGLEFKRTDAPRSTPSMRHALADLKLTGILVAYPGAKSYRIDAKITVVPLKELATGNADWLLRFS